MPAQSVSLRRGTALLMISNVGGAFLSFVLSALIGRVLGEIGLGVYAVAAAWAYPLALIADFGISTLMTRDLSANPDESEDYLGSVALIRAIFGGGLMLTVIVLAPVLSEDAQTIEAIRLTAPMIIILPFYSSFSAVFKARGGIGVMPYLNIGMLIAQVALTAAAFALGGGLRAALILNVLTSLGQLIAAYALYRLRFSKPPRHVPNRWTHARMLIRKAWHFALAALFAALQVRLSVILLEALTGAAETGYFSAASRFVEAARMVPNAFFGALFPALSAVGRDMHSADQTFRTAFRLLLAFGAACALGTWLLGGWAMELAFGERFLPAVPALHILMISLGFSVLRGARTLYWYARGREGAVNLVNALVIGLQAVLLFVLIPSQGAYGAAWAHVIVEVIGLGLLWLPLDRKAAPA